MNDLTPPLKALPQGCRIGLGRELREVLMEFAVTLALLVEAVAEGLTLLLAGGELVLALLQGLILADPNR